ncbi:MAG: YvcK family protein [Candidatus Sungbacteria bacterium]|nr:YvcK family protein [Candidatus Sungbacteria bacterium]
MLKKNKEKKPRIVVIGGGTGAFTVLSGLRKYPLELAAIVSMADDGGSTGVLREEFGILPPGDVRRVLVAMAHSDNRMMSELFNYRFAEGGLRGHTFGNIMLAALSRVTGSFEGAIYEASRILRVRGTVIPVTLDNVRLCAKLENGAVIRGESNIDMPKHDGRLHIKKLWLDPAAYLNKKAREAILAADMIVIGPGDLYTSIMPNLVVHGMRDAIRKSRAKKAYVVNLMTKWGETNGYAAADFVRMVEKELGGGVLHYALINSKHPSADRLRQYEKESSEFVAPGELSKKPVAVFGDFLRNRGFVRHDPDKLAKVLVSLI